MAGQRRESLIEIDDKAFLSTLKDAFGRLELKTAGDLTRVANDVVNRAKELCPVDTGRLRASIHASPLGHDGQGAYIDVGVTQGSMDAASAGASKKKGKRAARMAVGSHVSYAGYVEFGTSRMRPQSFMRSALAEVSGGNFQRRGAGPPTTPDFSAPAGG